MATLQDHRKSLVTAVRALFAVNALVWVVMAVVVWTGIIGIGLRDPASVGALALLMLGNAILLGFFAWRVLRGQRVIDYAALLWVAINLVLTITDEIGVYDLAALILNLSLLIMLVLCLKRR